MESPSQAYFNHWSHGRFSEAADLLSASIIIVTPLNDYAGKHEFVKALTWFAPKITVANFCEIRDSDASVQFYDMTVRDLGCIRIAERFRVKGGLIVELEQIHDTVLLKDAGF